MALFRQVFTRAGNAPDLPMLATAIRPTIGDPFYVYAQVDNGAWRVLVEKPTAWVAGDITTVQNAVTAAADATLQSDAQNQIDQMPIFQKAILLTLLDQINTLRTQPSTTFAAVTPAQAIAAVRTKAGTL